MKNYPVIKFTILFIIGILLAPLLTSNIFYFVFLIIFCTTLIIIFLPEFLNKELFLTILIFVLIILFGIFRANIKSKTELLPQNLFKQKNFLAYGTISKIDLIKKYEIKFYMDVDSIKIRNEVIPSAIKLIAQLRYENKNALDSVYEILSVGNKITLNGTYKKGREERNPGEFDYNKYLREKGISGILTSYNIEDLRIINHKKNEQSHTLRYIFANMVFNIRKSIDKSIRELHQPKTASLLRGLLLADRSEINFDTKKEFINSGVIHVLAVSGLHTGFIALILFFLFGRFNIYFRSIAIIIGLFAFMIITGIPASVFRAVIMAVVIIIAFLTNRAANLFNSISLAALIILLIEPHQIYSPGFQLSFLAVLSIAAIYPLIEKEIRKLNIKSKTVKYIVLCIAVSFSAQIGTLPLTLIYFGKLSLIAIAANLIVIPLIGIIIGIAVFTLIINLIFPGLALFYAAANDFITFELFKIIHFAGSLSFSYLPVRNFSIYDSMIFYFLLIFLIYFYYKFNSVFAKIILILLCAVNIIFFISLDNKPLLKPHLLNLIMVDVGQGDSFLLKFPNNQTALIDAGDVSYYFDNGERVVMPLLNYLGIKKIDYGFISHMDLDHFGGFVSLIHFKKIKQIYKPEIDSSNITDVRFENYLRENNIPFYYYKKSKFEIGNSEVYILNDIKSSFFNSFSKNNKSGLLKIDYGKTKFLFTGDIEKEAEIYYADKYKSFLKSDVLKTAHHGSITSSSINFIKFVKPKISLISDGIQNRFGHPSSIVLNRLKTIKSKIFRTDKLGAVLIISNGDSVYAVNWRK